MNEHQEGRTIIRTGLMAVVLVAGLTPFAQAARAEPAGGPLSCRNGLALHRSVSQSPDRTPLRMRSGLELPASERLLTITASVVKEAYIREYRERLGLRVGEQGPQVENPFVWVTLQLNQAGLQQLDGVLPGPAGKDLVVVCNETVLRAQLARYDTIQGVDVLIDEPSAHAAEEFARSFTSNIRWEQRTPAAR